MTKLMFIMFVLMIFNSRCESKFLNDSQVCYLVNHKTDSTWKLIYEEKFDDSSTFHDDWTVEHDNETCMRKRKVYKEISCNTADNVRITDNHLLVLQAKTEPYLHSEYTGSKVTSRQYFSYGRFEIRATVPYGKHIVASIHTENANESYWHENGQINIARLAKNIQVKQQVLFANSTDSDYRYECKKQQANLNEFHVYGIEWNEQRIQFFFDDDYSTLKQVQFTESKYLKPYHQISLLIGVGGAHFEATPLDQLEWKCPAMIVDYVRVFEQVNQTNIGNRSICSNSTKGFSEIQQICQQLNKTKLDYVTITTIVCICIIFILLIGYLFYRIQSLHHKLSIQEIYPEQYGMNIYENDNLYDIPDEVEDDNLTNTKVACQTTKEAIKHKEEEDEYLPIKSIQSFSVDVMNKVSNDYQTDKQNIDKDQKSVNDNLDKVSNGAVGFEQCKL